MFRFAFAMVAIAALAGCSSMSSGGGGSAPKPIDLARDDLGAIVLAFDVPRGVQPVETISTFNFDADSPTTGRHIKLALVRAEAAELDGLPPPSAQRVYYLLSLSDTDKARLRDAQKWASGLKLKPALSIAPHFCHDAPVDPNQVSVAVFAILPGGMRIAPYQAQTVAAAVQQSGGDFPACG